MATIQSDVRKQTLSPRAIIVLVTAAMIISVSMGVRQSLGLFLPPLNTELAISASAFGLAMALQNIVWGISQPFLGLMGDRYGARPVLVLSASIYAAGLLLMAWSNSPWALDGGLGVLAGLGIAGTGYGVLIGSVSRAVPPERRTRMVGLVSAAGSVATLVIAPLGQYVISGYGWRTALVVFAGFALAVAALALAIGREKEPSLGETDAPAQSASGLDAVRNSLGHAGFLAMTIAFFACGFQLMFITTHLAQYLALCGLPPSVSASAIGIIGISNAAGSYLFGVLGGRYSPKRLLASIYFFRTLSIVVFLAVPITPQSTLVFAAAMGFLWLGVLPLVSALIRGLFGLRYFNTLFGVAFFSHQVGGFLGSWLGGVAFDITGSYNMAWAGMVIVGLTATVIQWFMNDRLRPANGFGLSSPPEPMPDRRKGRTGTRRRVRTHRPPHTRCRASGTRPGSRPT